MKNKCFFSSTHKSSGLMAGSGGRHRQTLSSVTHNGRSPRARTTRQLFEQRADDKKKRIEQNDIDRDGGGGDGGFHGPRTNWAAAVYTGFLLGPVPFVCGTLFEYTHTNTDRRWRWWLWTIPFMCPQRWATDNRDTNSSSSDRAHKAATTCPLIANTHFEQQTSLYTLVYVEFIRKLKKTNLTGLFYRPTTTRHCKIKAAAVAATLDFGL